MSEVLKFNKVLFAEDEICNRVKEIGKQITLDYKDKQEDGIIVVGVLTGSVIFVSDLIRNIDLDFSLDFISVSSYHNSDKSSGKIDFEKDLSLSVFGKHVIIVEDIIDTGLTMKYLLNYFNEKNAASVKICTLLYKNKQKQNVIADYIGFNCANKYVVGYGLDYSQKYRNLPFVTSIDFN